ncbi:MULTISPECIES: hypothetical protein [unclassified Caballeronia]|uniref:hypothetical protein n=1 Tax=unclassified Caballeronia TaxID=2646786 RepID=UPI002028D7E0|nr:MULTISPECIES: hypothetical protein [unclassified Caballeronia]
MPKPVPRIVVPSTKNLLFFLLSAEGACLPSPHQRTPLSMGEGAATYDRMAFTDSHANVLLHVMAADALTVNYARSSMSTANGDDRLAVAEFSEKVAFGFADGFALQTKLWIAIEAVPLHLLDLRFSRRMRGYLAREFDKSA